MNNQQSSLIANALKNNQERLSAARQALTSFDSQEPEIDLAVVAEKIAKNRDVLINDGGKISLSLNAINRGRK